MGNRRQSSLLAAQRIRSQLASDQEVAGDGGTHKTQAAVPGRAIPKRRALSDALPQQEPLSRPLQHVDKRPRPGTKSAALGLKYTSSLQERLFGVEGDKTQAYACQSPSTTRLHSTLYHRPLLLVGDTGQRGRSSLLSWFDSVSDQRLMPWRKPFNPELYGDTAESRDALSVRAYEVWISEIMLQQTRVAVVKDYWTRWMRKWPTIVHLAAAHEDEVMAAWRGLGYYSRAKRIHEAAKTVVQHPTRRGLLPQTAKELEDEMAGVGRYTAGAKTAIAFGNADCMVDGNVLRVLSRQLGILGNVKSDKAVIDLLWAAARALVEVNASEHSEVDKETSKALPSDVPGRWGQALMELGSTICSPQPNCVACPINFTCRAFEEGRTVAVMKGFGSDNPHDTAGMVDMEDICRICSDWSAQALEDVTGDPVVEDKDRPRRPAKRSERTQKPSSTPTHSPSLPGGKGLRDHQHPLSSRAVEVVISHAKRFPVKISKKAIREEETVVCAVRRTSDGCYLIQKRPEKGLLAGLWELPSHVLPVLGTGSTASRRRIAREFVAGLFQPTDGKRQANVKYIGDLGSVPWVFSHLKLTMHVHSFEIEDSPAAIVLAERTRWADRASVEEETMGTGMRHCWKRVVAGDSG
ncbi:hypothetical protein N8I77_006496 [Diaporthe amygdali]|uniref:Adenine DNA glycosylase n=1 Tax=Phomopsis amygdali TaxID=1214568 RepID=A0AAD9SHW0_PHOAM|nr:hypothetical protein N8I77_006496 [Diaporthe amygdali]